MQNVASRGARRCNVVVALERRYIFMKTYATQSKYRRDFFQCNDGKLEEAEDFNCVFVVYSVLESK